MYAAASTCLHLFGPLDYKDGGSSVPWHKARFDMADGRRIDGPTPEKARLIFLPTPIEGEELVYV
ncbi:MAG: nitrite reductase/ring-hydroxylating ferredoxin subunit [Paracoccaceae bacterium]|jgi:nitrite reductase/ring-hydroxylating ferredoxin subunit